MYSFPCPLCRKSTLLKNIKYNINVNDTEEETCSICLDNYIKPSSLPCNHKFCKDCIVKYIETKLSIEKLIINDLPPHIIIDDLPPHIIIYDYLPLIITNDLSTINNYNIITN
jgi:hypothetical protein